MLHLPRQRPRPGGEERLKDMKDSHAAENPSYDSYGLMSVSCRDSSVLVIRISQDSAA